MFNTTTTYTVHPALRLDKIFPNGLPVNSFIDKGRCAIGATFDEIMNKERCSLIPVPNISILHSKKAAHPEIDIVYGNISYQEILDMFTVYKPGQKIMTTPEGMKRIMKAAAKTGRLEEVYNEWFLLLDEAHTYISENYREDILKPFDYFWEFKNKSIISATPYYFTDKRFETLHYHKVEFTDNLNEVILINSTSVIGTLNYLLQHTHKCKGNLHIFYNSVTEIRNAVLRAKLTDCNIYCADDEKGNNKTKLGDLVKHFVAEPITGAYKKVNFYTCKYFEGWDLYDANATIVLVTDIYKPHTKVGVGTKGKQAIGRLRDKAEQIIHITNHNYTKAMKPLDTFRKEYLHEATFLIKQYNEYVEDCKLQELAPKDDERLTKYADINKVTKQATLNLMKLDQQINEATNNEIYNNISYIKKDWEDAYFDVNSRYADIKLETTTTITRKSGSKQLEEDYLKLLAFKKEQQDNRIFYLGDTPEQEVKNSNPLAYKAYKHLDEAIMIKLNYNVKKVQGEVILKENSLAEVKLLRLLNNTFKVGERYTNEFIKSKLQEIYNSLNIREESGKIKTANANQLAERGSFEIKKCKIPTSKGEPVNGYIIIRPQFNLRMAA